MYKFIQINEKFRTNVIDYITKGQEQDRWFSLEVVWRSGCIMGCHPCNDLGFDSQLRRCKDQPSRPSQGTVNGGAVSR